MGTSGENSTNGEKRLLKAILGWLVGQTVILVGVLASGGLYVGMTLARHEEAISWIKDRLP